MQVVVKTGFTVYTYKKVYLRYIHLLWNNLICENVITMGQVHVHLCILVLLTSNREPSCNATYFCTISSVVADAENVTGTTGFLIMDGLESNLDYIFVMAAIVTATEENTIQGPLSEEVEFSFVSEGKSSSSTDARSQRQIVPPCSQHNFLLSLSLSCEQVST